MTIFSEDLLPEDETNTQAFSQEIDHPELPHDVVILIAIRFIQLDDKLQYRRL